MNKTKGAITITAATLFASVALFAGGFVTYFSSRLATNDRIAEVEAKAAVLGNEDKNINKRFDAFENNINDRFDHFESLLKKNGR